MVKMAESLSAGLGEEKEEKDKEKERWTAKSEKDNNTDRLRETLGFSEKNGGNIGKKRNLSGER